MTRQLARSPYLAGDAFTAADISVSYALRLAQKGGGYVLSAVELAYLARVSERDGYKRAVEACHDTRNWWASVPPAE